MNSKCQMLLFFALDCKLDDVYVDNKCKDYNIEIIYKWFSEK